MKIALWIAGIALALWTIDRVLVWCELRGWIAYRLTPRVRHGAGSMLPGLEVFFRPEGRHVIQLRQDVEVYRKEDEDGDDPPDTANVTSSRPTSPPAPRAEHVRQRRR